MNASSLYRRWLGCFVGAVSVVDRGLRRLFVWGIVFTAGV